MIGARTRRSIVFQLWLRLSVITVAFTFIALGFYLWLVISDSIDEAHEEAFSRADAVAAAAARIALTGPQPSFQEIAVATALDIEAIYTLRADGSATAAARVLRGSYADLHLDLAGEVPTEPRAVGLKIDEGIYEQHNISTLDLLRGGKYGAAFVYPTPWDESAIGVGVVVSYDHLAAEALTLLLRSVALTGAILAVAVLAMWLLLNRFVARPLREYSRTAMRIATGEPLRLPDVGNNELGELGQAINSMAQILRHQATVDSLTGLYNQRHLTDRLEDFLTDARSKNEPLALLVCDLDNLKPVNDTYGHQAGDLLLKAVARHLLIWAGLDYTCWRTGGDEFAAVIPNLEPEQALRATEQLEAAINATTVSVPGGLITISLSIGIASYPADGESGGDLMNAADRRMYESKAGKSKGLRTPAAS